MAEYEEVVDLLSDLGIAYRKTHDVGGMMDLLAPIWRAFARRVRAPGCVHTIRRRVSV